MTRGHSAFGVAALVAAALCVCTRAQAEEKVLFDFEAAADATAWVMEVSLDPKKPEPQAALEVAAEHATRGAHALKLTYAGGVFPTIVTKQIPEDLTPFATIKADVTVPRPMVVGLCIKQEKDKAGPEEGWLCTMFLKGGLNEVSFSLKKPQQYRTRPYSAQQGGALSLAFLVYSPNEGDQVYVDNIRVSTEDDPNADNKLTPNGRPTDGYKVLGTDMTVKDVAQLGAKLKDAWVKPEKEKSVEEREAEFKALHDEMKKAHPKAVRVMLREGEKGFDPADPEKAYAGWESVYVNSHGPDGGLQGRAFGQYDWGNLELFMRHRSQLMRINLSVLPKGAKILAARLLLVASYGQLADKPNMFAAEACNKPWVDGEANCYRWAKDKLWHWAAGQYYEGDDADFLPLFLAYGPCEGQTNVWDFTEAVRFWTDGKHENHGFFLHGDAGFYARTFTRRAEDVKKRPALMVIYEP